MKKFIPKEKLSKKARKQLDSEQRTTWTFSPDRKRWKVKSSTTAREKPMTVTLITVWAFLLGIHAVVVIAKQAFQSYLAYAGNGHGSHGLTPSTPESERAGDHLPILPQLCFILAGHELLDILEQFFFGLRDSALDMEQI